MTMTKRNRYCPVVVCVSMALVFVLSSLCFAGVRWSENGSPVCNDPFNQYGQQVTSDGAGGAIITWTDYRMGNADIYAQRLDADGVAQWPPNESPRDGIEICAADGDQMGPRITSDGAGGAIITWMDYHTGNFDIYAQRVDANGVAQWPRNMYPSNPVAICTANGDQVGPRITGDGAGGAIIAWEDDRIYNEIYRIYVQKVDKDGHIPSGWQQNGVDLPSEGIDDRFPEITGDGAGGAIITWNERDVWGSFGIYAQRIDENGNTPQGWNPNMGVALCMAMGDQHAPQIALDGAGGAIVAWQDDRDYNRNGADIYAQRVDAHGVLKWPIDDYSRNGVAVCTESHEQISPLITVDGAGGAVITWIDYRNGIRDIYAQRINADGETYARWPDNGESVCFESSELSSMQITGDGAGGAIITWSEYRSDNQNIYAQWIDWAGVLRWSSDSDGQHGFPICDESYDQISPAITSDDDGGAVIVWCDERSDNNGENSDIYAQRVSTAKPVVNSITPNLGKNGGTVHITNLAGANFCPGASVCLVKFTDYGRMMSIGATNVIVVSPNKITCDFDLTGAKVGKWDLFVTNNDGQHGVKKGAFTVKSRWLAQPGSFPIPRQSFGIQGIQ